jgi:hypothetical protein
MFDTITDPLGIKKKTRKALGVEKAYQKVMDPFGHVEKLEDKAKKAIGFDFEKYNFSQMWEQLKDNPARILYGAFDPASTKLWNEVLGRDDDPIISQMGGPTKQRYVDYIEQGGDPRAASNAATAHQIAATIASIYAGGALGAMMPAMGAGAGAAGAGAGAGAGAAGGAAAGTAGGLTAAIPAGATFSAGLSGTGALATAAINAAAAEADEEFQPPLVTQPRYLPPPSFMVGNVGSPTGYFAKGGLAKASAPRRYRRQR